MARQATLPLILSKPIQLSQLIQHLHIIQLDIVRHVRDLNYMALITQFGADITRVSITAIVHQLLLDLLAPSGNHFSTRKPNVRIIL